MRYSALSILMNGLRGNKAWKPAWRDPAPKPHYDIIIVGGGGHGLATAYYLAKEFGITNVAVLEKNYIGSGNVGRNTTIIRSNYLLPGNNPFYELSMKLWEGLEQDFNFNAMVSQRGVLNLYHSDAQRDAYTVAAMPCGCTASMPNCWIGPPSNPCCRFSISTMRAFPFKAGCYSGAAAQCVTMRLPGAMPAGPINAASTSSRAAK